MPCEVVFGSGETKTTAQPRLPKRTKQFVSVWREVLNYPPLQK